MTTGQRVELWPARAARHREFDREMVDCWARMTDKERAEDQAIFEGLHDVYADENRQQWSARRPTTVLTFRMLDYWQAMIARTV